MFKKNHKKRKEHLIDPEDIFFDAQNTSSMDQQQFEGVMQKPISRAAVYIFLSLIMIILVIFAVKLWQIQVRDGAFYFATAEKNRLDTIEVFAKRGIIFDRHDVALIENVPSDEIEGGVERLHRGEGFAHLLGYVKYPERDDHGNLWRRQTTGISGIEKTFDRMLGGINGAILVEVDATGNQKSNNSLLEAIPGENINLSIDAEIQIALYQGIKDVVSAGSFVGGSGIIMDIHTGEIIAMTNFPEFDINTLARGDDAQINRELNDPRNKFLNRALYGLYSPGSTVKPFLALAALHEGNITDTTSVQSTGAILVPNIYNPDNPSIFRDWRAGGHGWTDLYHAIADSVNTYFYMIGGGYNGVTGLGIDKINEYMLQFGLGQEIIIEHMTTSAGVVPSREWKTKVFDDRWYLGDTYNTSIGQFGFLTTPMHMVRAVAAIANQGELVTPIILRSDNGQADGVDTIFTSDEYAIIHRAMRQTITNGTAQNLNGLRTKIAGKTGTAQVGPNNEFINSWFIGFYPYDEPKYAVAIVLERGESGGHGSASQAMRNMFDILDKESSPPTEI